MTTRGFIVMYGGDIAGPSPTCRVIGCRGPSARTPQGWHSAHGFCVDHLHRMPRAFRAKWDAATSQRELERLWQQIEDDFLFDAPKASTPPSVGAAQHVHGTTSDDDGGAA